MKQICILGFVFSLFLVAPAGAQGLLMPDPVLTPGRVIEIQLRSLQTNDQPTPDAGIAQAWVFAHPDNKRATGPLERFTLMLKGANYRSMLNHRAHAIEPVVETADSALFSVALIAADGERLAFKWELMKVGEGDYAGAWMTTYVSPPLEAGDAT